MSETFEYGDKVEFIIKEGSSTWMTGTVYAVLKHGLVVILVGDTFYDADPKDVRHVKSNEQV